jgi:uncharacterized protein (TIGR02452 family)
MAIAIRAFTIVVPIRSIENRYPGGIQAWLEDAKDAIGHRVWLDGRLTAVSHFDPEHADDAIRYWRRMGFVSRSEGNADVLLCALVDAQLGLAPTSDCDWLEFDPGVPCVWLKGEPRGQVAVPAELRDKLALNSPPAEPRTKILASLRDSTEMADECKRQLDIPMRQAANLASSALAAMTRGRYADTQGRQVDWHEALARARAAKRTLAPDAALPPWHGGLVPMLRIEVSNESTLSAARRFVDQGLAPLVLNFANGIRPGGGWLGGALAQEETLFRSTGLFHALDGDPMYEHPGRLSGSRFSDWTILAPDVPVFRDAHGLLLDRPWLADIISCAAPFAPGIGQPEAGDLLRQRIQRVLSVSRAFGYRALVLGAWGCGAYGNDVERTAKDFAEALAGDFLGAFSDVVFAIPDWSPERRTLAPFWNAFAPFTADDGPDAS